MKKIEAPDKVIFICDGKKCGQYSKEIRKEFRIVLKDNGLRKEVEVVKMQCSDNCKHAPVISIQPKNVWIGEVEEKNVTGIVKDYF
jgi:(2Fe-2S) ferredoxin